MTIGWRNLFQDLQKSISMIFSAIKDKRVWHTLNAQTCYFRYIKFRKIQKKEIKKIGFMIPSIQFLHHFLPIAKHLDNASYSFIPINGDPLKIDAITQVLNTQNLPYEYIWDLIKKKSHFRVLVSNAPLIGVEPIPPFLVGSKLLSFLGNIQVRMMYAGGKLKWNFSDWNKFYNYIFCYGPFYKKLFEKKFLNLKVLEVGYPRFDDYFVKEIHKKDTLKRMGLSTARKTIVYLPTHGDLSTYENFKSLIYELSHQYNVIIKVHEFLNICLEEGGGSLYLAHNDDNNIQYFKLADYIIADYGGSVLGAIYADKNLILLDVKNPLESENIDSGSPELFVRKYIKGFKEKDIDNITRMLKDKEYWKTQKISRKILREKFFKVSPCSGEFAAYKLLELLEKGEL